MSTTVSPIGPSAPYANAAFSSARRASLGVEVVFDQIPCRSGSPHEVRAGV
jgi:hypothetical protein